MLLIKHVRQPFKNAKWRAVLTEICNKLDIHKLGLQVISPFGFEILEDKMFLYRKLKRFYCYLGLPKKMKSLNLNVSDLIEKFYKDLSNKIPIYFPELTNDFILIIKQNNFIKLRSNIYKCKINDKLLDIQFRYFDKTLLHDYGDYVISSLTALKDNKDEIKEFGNNSRFRSRTYQLYLMVENLFGYLLPNFSEINHIKYKSIFSKISNTVEIFYDESKLYVPASEDDLLIMNTIIKPRIAMMLEKIVDDKDNIIVKIGSYHGSDKLSILISYKKYIHAQDKIITSYKNFQ